MRNSRTQKRALGIATLLTALGWAAAHAFAQQPPTTDPAATPTAAAPTPAKDAVVPPLVRRKPAPGKLSVNIVAPTAKEQKAASRAAKAKERKTSKEAAAKKDGKSAPAPANQGPVTSTASISKLGAARIRPAPDGLSCAVGRAYDTKLLRCVPVASAAMAPKRK